MSFSHVGVSPAVTRPDHHTSMISSYHGEGTPSPGLHPLANASTARMYFEFHVLSKDLMNKHRGQFLFLVSGYVEGGYSTSHNIAYRVYFRKYL
jgi:hypothetical protein